MGYIRRIIDLLGNNIYPVTKTNAIYDDNNVRLDITLENMNSEINTHADLLGGHKIEADVPAGAKFTDTIYTHPNSGVTAGTYRSVTVNTQGHVTAGSNPTTLSGYGITDAVNKNGDTMTGFLTLHADPTQSMHAVTKQYVDNLAMGLDVRPSVRVATTENLDVSASTSTSLTVPNTTTIDGVTLAVGNRVLVKNQTNKKQNGIYVWVSSGYMERASDADTDAKITSGMFTFVEEGDTNKNSGWLLTTKNPIVVGTTELIFVQFTGAGQITAGTGLAKDGNTLYIENTGVTAGTYKSVTVNARGQVTAGSNPTTLAGYGITDAAPSSHVGATGDAHGVATTSVNGFMSSSDKSKLDGIAAGANNYTHPNSGVTAGTYRSVTVDAQGHVTAGSNPTTVAGYGITDAVKKTGDTMTGFLTLHADPTQSMHAVTKQYVDMAALSGIDVKASVRAATTANIPVSSATNTRLTLSSALTTIDGVTLKVGDRILIKNQTTASQNGIYTYMSSSYLDRTGDADSDNEVTSMMFTFVEEGTVNENSGWILITKDPITVGTTALNFVQFTGAGQITAGTGLTKNGNTLSLSTSGVTAGTYKSVTVDAYGRVTAGSNPTTLAGYGITDAAPSSHVGATGDAHGVATTSTNGFMSSVDKSKLDGIAAGANNYTHPNSGVTAGTYRSVTVNAQGHITSGSNPTTLSGYGITDAVKKSGDTITGELIIKTSSPVLSIQDSDSTGNAHKGIISLKDSNGVEKGWIGFNSTDNTYLNIYNSYDLVNGVQINGYTAWHAGNGGAGSGLDADLLDGKHASDFALSSHTHSNYAASSHTHAASSITAGALPTGVVATNSTDYTTSRVRNARFGTTVPSSLENGEIYFLYE